MLNDTIKDLPMIKNTTVHSDPINVSLAYAITYVFILLRMQQVFDANKDRESVIRNLFDPPIRARLIRLHPVKWQNGICMRFEFIGCRYQCKCHVKRFCLCVCVFFVLFVFLFCLFLFLFSLFSFLI